MKKIKFLHSKFKAILLIILFVASSFQMSGQTWKNPFILPSEWSLYGIGDPYILKFNGYFYLYCSTRDSETGVKCWSSKDLRTWTYKGLCATDPITKGAYAPEVIYYGGKFYMYTSPAGNGHYILRSESPTGPFTIVTTNLGHSIDGSVLKDDSGSLYFYHAGDDGIHAHTMPTPTTIGGDMVLGSTRMNGWTEGPCVIKRDGKYYMIYTGNHVLNRGYRIDLAVSSLPSSGFVSQIKQNPVILSTEGSFFGLGHGSITKGPDLDSHYILYHNFAGDYGVGPYRHLNFDRIGWNGTKMIVMGPTNSNQVAPDLPDFSDYFEGTTLNANWTVTSGATWTVNGTALSLTPDDINSVQANMALAPGQTGDYFTAELNAQEVQKAGIGSTYGVVFNYTDNQNYGTAVFNSATNSLEINTRIAGTWGTVQSMTLPGVTDYTKFHCIRLERKGSSHLFFVDGMLKKTLTITQASGRIGYYSLQSNVNFGPAAYSRKVDGNGIFNDYKPVPGTIDAALYKGDGEGISYHDVTPANTETAWRTDSVETIKTLAGDYVVLEEKGEWLKYAVMVKATANYNTGLKYASATASRIRISQVGSENSTVIDLPATGGNNAWRTKIIEGLPMTIGKQDLQIEVLDGSLMLYTMRFVESPVITLPQTDNLDQTSFGSKWTYNDGIWNFSNQELVSDGYGKCLYGSAFTNYMATVDINYQTNINGGLIVRANNPSLGGTGRDLVNDPQAGTDFVQAYFVSLGANGCTLGKQNYNWTKLASSTGTYTSGKWYKLAVKVVDDNIKVYVDDMNTPVIDYTDPDPFIAGKVGFRTFNSIIHFNNLEITPVSNISGIETPKSTGLEIYPNPVRQNVHMNFPTPTQKGGSVELYSMNGIRVFQASIPENSEQYNIPVSHLSPGLFLLKYNDCNQTYSAKIQIDN